MPSADTRSVDVTASSSMHQSKPDQTVSSSDSDSLSDTEFIEVRSSAGSSKMRLHSEESVVSSLNPVVVDAQYTNTVLLEAKDLLLQSQENIEEVLVEQVIELERRTVQQEKRSAGVTNLMYQEAQVSHEANACP